MKNAFLKILGCSHRLVRVAPLEEEDGATEEEKSCEKENEKKSKEEEKEKEKRSKEEEKEKEIEKNEEQTVNGRRGEESEGEVFLLENMGYRGYREDVLKDRLRSYMVENLMK